LKKTRLFLVVKKVDYIPHIMKQGSLFNEKRDLQAKTYRAIRHDVVRQNQEINHPGVHHPEHQINQIMSVILSSFGEEKIGKLNILELFAGRGNLTKVFKQYGVVDSFDKKWLKTGDSFIRYHEIIANKSKYDVVDIDPYGFPNRFFPDIFLIIDRGVMFITMPKPSVNILNGITAAHLISYYGEENPSERAIIDRIALWGLCHWRKVQLINRIDCNSVWRFAFSVERVKATDYTGVKNR
jgi:hypothetical protein